MPPDPDSPIRPTVRLFQLLGTFVRLGVMTFGGSVQSWVHREVVERLGWLDEKAFLSGLTVAQVLPGANPVNIALYVGLELCGGVGAAVAVLGMIVPAFCVILCLGYFYRGYGHLAAVHFVLAGLAASGVGATHHGHQGGAPITASSHDASDCHHGVHRRRRAAMAHGSGGAGRDSDEHRTGVPGEQEGGT
jgi:hypothetical protein